MATTLAGNSLHRRSIRTNHPKTPSAATAPSRRADVVEWVLSDVGARPWDRDAVDRRLLEEARAGQGRVIDSKIRSAATASSRSDETYAPCEPRHHRHVSWERGARIRPLIFRTSSGHHGFESETGIVIPPGKDVFLGGLR